MTELKIKDGGNKNNCLCPNLAEYAMLASSHKRKFRVKKENYNISNCKIQKNSVLGVIIPES